MSMHAIKPMLGFFMVALFASNVHATAQLALDKGCYSCHGSPPKKNAPTFEKLAQEYVKYKNVPSAETDLANKLREGHIFGGIQAHERLSEESARLLVHWIIQGAH